ncbi:DUF4297 domain-containing protein [Xenorhabdus sp. Vera]|uniref:DUF4297 domain-containing protein n=1 Tax=Xenorhabdus koppenhoeferi TaxID=351659 RepID=UPI00199449CC|nr:DUF4297 domain-containing protein [Xenorhabdus sp. Vera]MBD2811446.1 DUF4297 domain-containing protein [Xenorhabdus sp. Vera]
MTDNILAEVQRESAGASTFGKYNFQYHWALCRIIEKHQKNEEYALLIEYHEDVVIADNLDGTKANFEFFQVKNQIKTFTEHELTKRSRGANETLKNSVLGKLLSSCVGTQYDQRITNIGLVSAGGFSLGVNKGLKLDVIRTGDLTAACLQSLTNRINEELGINLLPKHLQFIVPEIQLENQEDYVLAQFVKLVDGMFPGAQCSAVAIYRAIIDEMGRKIRITFDYTGWDRLIDKKSLTSVEVHEVLVINSSHPSVNEIKEDFNRLAQQLGWKTRQIRNIRTKLSQLFLKRTGFMTALDIDIIGLFKASADKINETLFDSEALYIEALLQQAKADGLENKIPDPDEFLVEIIYCLLTSE